VEENNGKLGTIVCKSVIQINYIIKGMEQVLNLQTIPSQSTQCIDYTVDPQYIRIHWDLGVIKQLKFK